ncbi:hypothetical protein ACS0TY_034715 [Phlomoides rotata]
MKNKLSRASTMDKLLQFVHDELDLAKKTISTEIRRYFKDRNHSSADQRNMKLKFTNKISDEVLTSEEIKGEGGAHLEVALVDGPSEKTVDVGPEASARVEIVLLKGEPDADDEEFHQSIIPETQGKKPLLDGDVAIRLERGVGVVQNVKLRNHAIEIRPSVFKLGATVVDAFRVKEAKTESFNVKDFRKKYRKKHENPSLSDEVSRLHNIAKGGKIYKRLQSNGINTVEHFLIWLLINRDELKNIVNMVPTKWEETIENARKCLSETRMYCYINLEQKKCVVFNVLGQAIGLYDEFHYSVMMNMLSEEHKADAEELLASAYKNWGDVKPFDDRDSLQHHLITCLTTYPINPDCPGGGDEAAEIIGESSNRRSNASFHSVSSAMNLVRDTGGEDFSSFGTDDVDAETMYDAPVPSPLDVEGWIQGFDDYLQQKDDEQSGAAFEVVLTSDSPKRWKNLLPILMFLIKIKKRGSVVDVAPHRKKQKIG